MWYQIFTLTHGYLFWRTLWYKTSPALKHYWEARWRGDRSQWKISSWFHTTGLIPLKTRMEWMRTIWPIRTSGSSDQVQYEHKQTRARGNSWQDELHKPQHNFIQVFKEIIMSLKWQNIVCVHSYIIPLCHATARRNSSFQITFLWSCDKNADYNLNNKFNTGNLFYQKRCHHSAI